MTLLEIPLWGQWGILGMSLGFNLFILVSIVRGVLVPYNRVEDANKNTDRWQQGFENSEQTKHEVIDLMRQLMVTSQTMERILNALPTIPVPQREGDT